MRNPQLAKSAIIDADYQCEVTLRIKLFKQTRKVLYGRTSSNPLYGEKCKEIEEQFSKNIDCKENIVSLCPICHRAIHMGNRDEKKRVLSNLISKRLPILKKIGINITEEYLFRLYGVE